MNYIKILADYGETIDVLFKDHNEERDHSELLSPDRIQTMGINSSGSSSKLTPAGRCFVSLATLLEQNLDARSKLYSDAALQHLFLMNNMHYMVQKVRGSELKPIFGDEWIRKHNWICYKCALEYERASWASTILLLNKKEIDESMFDKFSLFSKNI